MAKNGTWERVESQLYRLKHPTPLGEWTTRYYVRFKDWKGINRKFPAGTDLRAARSKKSNRSRGETLSNSDICEIEIHKIGHILASFDNS